VDNSPNDRPVLALALEWVSRITTISLEMSLPALLGYWADRELGTKPLFLVLGGIAGFGLGLWHLLKLAALPPTKNRRRGGRRGTNGNSTESCRP
jgi:ATP synthase protein I